MYSFKKLISILLSVILTAVFALSIFAGSGQNPFAYTRPGSLISLDQKDGSVKNAKQSVTGTLSAGKGVERVTYEVYCDSDAGGLAFEGEADVAGDTFTVKDLKLKPSGNTIVVTAYTADGKKDTQTVNIDYDSGKIKNIPGKNVAKAYRDSDIKYANNNLLIFFEEGTDYAKRQTVADAVGGKCVGYISGINMWQVEVKPDSYDGLQKTAERLTAMDEVFYASCNMVGAAAPMVTIPNDPWYLNGSPAWSELRPRGGNWSVEAIQALSAWDYQYFFSNIKVGIVDAGVQDNHEDLTGKVFFPDAQSIADNDPYDNHGTHVAGIIGAIPNNGKGVTGILWNTTMYSYNWEVVAGTDAHLMLGLTKTVQAGAKVVNFSLGLANDISYLGPPETNTQVIAYANLSATYMAPLLNANYEFIVVQSSGNGINNVSQDAIYNGYFCSVTLSNITLSISTAMKIKINERIIIVGSAQNNGDLIYGQASSSNSGSQVDICAPGVNIYSCYAGDNYNYMSGTSMAAPVVAGVAALAWSVKPTMTGADVRSILLDVNNTAYSVSPHPSQSIQNTFRMVNAKKAVEAVILTIPVDYSAVHTAVAAANALNANLYTPASWTALTNAVNAVDYTLNSLSQVQINTYAANINTAIANLVLKTVNYTVEYRLNTEDGAKLAPDKNAAGQVTKTVAETAVAISGYEAFKKSITLTLALENNKIIFIYVDNPVISAAIGTYKSVGGSPVPVTAARPGETITVTVTPTANFYCGTSRYVVLYDKNFYSIVGSGKQAILPNTGNAYYQNTVTDYGGLTTSPPDAWPATFTAGEKAQYNFIIATFTAGAGSENGGYPSILSGDEPLFSFRLKVKDDASGSGRIFMDSRWTRTATVTGEQYFFLCPNALTPSGSGVTQMNFISDFALADKVVGIDTAVTVAFDLNGGTGTAPVLVAGEPGSVCTLPVQSGFEREFYSFAGWAATPEATEPLASYVFPQGDTVLYAVWHKIPAAIEVKSGASTVIDSAGFIYGLQASMTQADFENLFVLVSGNARLEITTLSGSFGTGTRVDLIDNETQEIAASYLIVIFGDVNGDGNIDSADAGKLIDYENYALEWDPVLDAARLMAGDVNNDGNLDSSDAGMVVDAENYLLSIDQTRG